MNIRQSILGEVAIHDGPNVQSVDVGALVRRILLFDKVVVKSIRLREIPLLVRTFGHAGLSELLNSGILKLCCEFTVLGMDFRRNGVRSVPEQHFHFGVIDAYDRDGMLRAELRGLQSVSGLKNLERAALEQAIWDSLVRPPDMSTYGAGMMAAVESDLRANTTTLKTAITEQVQLELGNQKLSNAELVIKVEEKPERIFYIRNNLTETFGIPADRVHLILNKSVTALANLNHRLAEMQAYSAITGFSEAEAPLLFGKLATVVAPLNPKVSESQFERVIAIADIPDFDATTKVDVGLLLKVRESAECREFRDWLSTLEAVSDSDVRHLVTGLRSRVASLTSSMSGKAVRFAAITGIGLIPGVGLAAGVVAGVLDSFVVDRILPRSGIVAFLTETYPSLFISS